MGAPCSPPLAATSPTLLPSFYASGTVGEHEHWHGHRRHTGKSEGFATRDFFSHYRSSL
jgi:hypothetical protein